MMGCALIAVVLALPASERETFLREAAIVGQQVIETGITLPEMLELERNGVRRRAAFKSREVQFPDQIITVGLEQQRGLRDSWKFEVAAYELDKLLGVGMVPVTIVRTIGDHQGAVIDWIDGVLPAFETSPEGFRLDEWEDEVATVWLFDYLAYNIDRTPDNLLITEGFEVRLIDHSRAFQRFVVPMRPLVRFPRKVISALRSLGEDDFRSALGEFLTREELEALLDRRNRVLERVDELLTERAESEVFF